MNGQCKRPLTNSSDISSQEFSGLHSHSQQAHSGSSADVDLSVQAYEATLVYGQEAFAEKLRLPEDQGGHLIRWTGSDGDVMEEGQADRQGESELWIDRYDILHLLSALPSKEPNLRASSPLSSTGWSELASDAEDTFFFSGDEGDDYERGKKRRRLEAGRAERLEAMKQRMEQEAADKEERQALIKGKEDVWGGHDEEPPSAIKTLMEHTAKSLLSSPNPQVLELRILTHHAGDARFSFLKGRYKDTWEAIKRGEKPKGVKEEAGISKGGLGRLMGDYGDSDSEDSDVVEGVSEPPSPPQLPPSPPLPASASSIAGETNTTEEVSAGETAQNGMEDEDKEAQARTIRREKALAWMAARRLAGDRATGKH